LWPAQISTLFGGSSRVFSNALNAAVLNMWHSSMTYTLYSDTGHRGKLRPVNQFADVINSGVAGGVNFDKV
jgi:hypothetical protein